MHQSSISSTTEEKDCQPIMLQVSHKRPHFTIDWRNLTYYHRERRSLLDYGISNRKSDQLAEKGLLRGKKLTLDSLDGCFKSGQLNAVLGPSGAGKSTFLSALFGNKQDSAFGQTKVTWFEDPKHQVPIDSLIKQRPIRIAFLPQHDHLLNHLSVHETLMFASKIKNATKLNEMRLGAVDREQFHKQNVKRVAKMLKLVECLQTRCGKLSGGQYKRVSIAQELLSEPDVIILDEPTSGLDAMTCLTTVKTLKSIAMKHPISIILTIHQPDSDVFNLFDQVYVIAQGGRAIYEGPPDRVAETMARANLHMPNVSYNPARFIVENAFIIPPEFGEKLNAEHELQTDSENTLFSSDEDDGEIDDEVFKETKESFETSDQEDDENGLAGRTARGGPCESTVLKRSLLSLTEAIKGKDSPILHTFVDMSPLGSKKIRKSGRRPLLNIGGVKTSDGKLITNNQLEFLDRRTKRQEALDREALERLNLLKELNEIQKSKYHQPPALPPVSILKKPEQPKSTGANSDTNSDISTESRSSCSSRPESVNSKSSSDEENHVIHDEGQGNYSSELVTPTVGLASGDTRYQTNDGSSVNRVSSNKSSGVGSTISYANSLSFTSNSISIKTTSGCSTLSSRFSSGSGKLKRQFDKCLSAKHSNSKQKDYPVYYHSYLLTNRTWLSIVRDPVFFGIQFCMHTTIPILLALIFGSQQEEGCPRVGQFDLVDFAYQSDSDDFIRGTMRSIRQSIGNIGVLFFEMFVLCFAINCITALVFPLDMYVLLKEYRNGWYSLRSYFIGRTLADLPVPIVLHSMALLILYFMTGQPHDWWRFGAIILIVIMASLVAQSVGLTIGALLMQSSQSAVLAAAGIVAPFFALSGFIVRIHTLPWVAQWAAQGSYLYHLLNGFIIMRYGFGRCPCEPTDFEENGQHSIPHNLRTMASIWIGTYSNEYNLHNATHHQGRALLDGATNEATAKTNVDPNIDLVDKLESAFTRANSYGHKVDSCEDVLPYAMLDFNLRDHDIWACCIALLLMLFVTRLITFSAIYYKIRSFA